MKHSRSFLLGLFFLALFTVNLGPTAQLTVNAPVSTGSVFLAQMTAPEPEETPALGKKKQGKQEADDGEDADEDSDDNDDEEEENEDDES